MKRRERKSEKLIDWLESDFKVLGSTAVEDNLQDQVVDTIQHMKDANIKVWMLTGDKEETAVNIGFSTGLLNNNVEKLYINASKKSDVYEQLNENKNAQTKAITNG